MIIQYNVCPYLGVAMCSQSIVEEEAISDHVLHRLKSETLQNRHSSEIVK